MPLPPAVKQTALQAMGLPLAVQEVALQVARLNRCMQAEHNQSTGCEAVHLPERMASIFGDWGNGLLRFAVNPIVLVLLCAWWLPQHPAFRWSTYKGVLDA